MMYEGSAHWIELSHDDGSGPILQCSLCGYVTDHYEDTCPHCEVDMYE